MEDANRRKRVNRYKKLILRTLLLLVIITIILWIYIVFKVNDIEDKINNLNLMITYNYGGESNGFFKGL